MSIVRSTRRIELENKKFYERVKIETLNSLTHQSSTLVDLGDNLKRSTELVQPRASHDSET
jgi:hypothetical protein